MKDDSKIKKIIQYYPSNMLISNNFLLYRIKNNPEIKKICV